MATDPKLTRGFRNKNPGNIDMLPPDRAWDGQVGLGDEWLPQERRRFARFESHAMGIRALAGQLVVNQTRHRRMTVRQQITRWAPPNENNTDRYVQSVARAVGVSADAQIDVRQHRIMFPMVKAIINKELGGVPYTDAEINEGLALYGITPHSQAAPVRTVRAAASTGTGRAAITTGGTLAAVGGAAPAVAALNGLHWAVGVAVVLAAAIGVVAYLVLKRREA